METKKMTKEEKKRMRRQALVERLRNTPSDKLSKAAKWMLKSEEEGNEYWMDMKAVLK